MDDTPLWARIAIAGATTKTGHRYGRYRWVVVLEASGTAVEVDCDDVEFTPAGGLVFYGTFALDSQASDPPPRRPTLAFAAGQWRTAFASTQISAQPLAAHYWPGYV
jgi:hypothetical protein